MAPLYTARCRTAFLVPKDEPGRLSANWIRASPNNPPRANPELWMDPRQCRIPFLIRIRRSRGMRRLSSLLLFQGSAIKPFVMIRPRKCCLCVRSYFAISSHTSFQAYRHVCTPSPFSTLLKARLICQVCSCRTCVSHSASQPSQAALVNRGTTKAVYRQWCLLE